MVLYQCMHSFLVLSSAAVSWCVVAFCVLGAFGQSILLHALALLVNVVLVSLISV